MVLKLDADALLLLWSRSKSKSRSSSLSSEVEVGEVGSGCVRAWTAASSSRASGGGVATVAIWVSAAFAPVAGDAGGLFARLTKSTKDGLAWSLGRSPSCIQGSFSL